MLLLTLSRRLAPSLTHTLTNHMLASSALTPSRLRDDLCTLAVLSLWCSQQFPHSTWDTYLAQWRWDAESAFCLYSTFYSVPSLGPHYTTYFFVTMTNYQKEMTQKIYLGSWCWKISAPCVREAWPNRSEECGEVVHQEDGRPGSRMRPGSNLIASPWGSISANDVPCPKGYPASPKGTTEGNMYFKA